MLLCIQLTWFHTKMLQQEEHQHKQSGLCVNTFCLTKSGRRLLFGKTLVVGTTGPHKFIAPLVSWSTSDLGLSICCAFSCCFGFFFFGCFFKLQHIFVLFRLCLSCFVCRGHHSLLLFVFNICNYVEFTCGLLHDLVAALSSKELGNDQFSDIRLAGISTHTFYFRIEIFVHKSVLWQRVPLPEKGLSTCCHNSE